MIKAQIIKDSYNGCTDTRLTTMLVRFHRFILPEINTHRAFSRNTSSSRARPISKMIKQVRENPAIPVSFGANSKNMFATSENNTPVYNNIIGDTLDSKDAWIEAANLAADRAEEFLNAGYHKQIVNRLLEPFMWTDMVISATDWDNFFALRISYDAQPEIIELALSMKTALDNSVPDILDIGKWHTPFVDTDNSIIGVDSNKLSVVRCARVSYKTPLDDDYDINKDLDLYNTLYSSGHYSPFEHCATPVDSRFFKDLTTNFNGFVQLRKLVEMGIYG